MKLTPFYQNNRLYLDGFSNYQIHGLDGSGYECGPYSKYEDLGLSQTVGGFRVPVNKNAHPCGFPMKTILDGTLVLNQMRSMWSIAMEGLHLSKIN